jgi:transposase
MDATTQRATPTEATALEALAVRQMIHSALRHNAAGQQLHRLDGVLLVALGHSCTQVAAWFGAHPRTVHRWVLQAKQQGAHGLAQHHGGGPHAVVGPAQLHLVRQLLQQPPSAAGCAGSRWTGKRLAQQLRRQWGLVLSERSCQRLIAAARQHQPARQRGCTAK